MIESFDFSIGPINNSITGFIECEIFYAISLINHILYKKNKFNIRQYTHYSYIFKYKKIDNKKFGIMLLMTTPTEYNFYICYYLHTTKRSHIMNNEDDKYILNKFKFNV